MKSTCPNCGKFVEPEVLQRRVGLTDTVTFYNCTFCDFSTWDERDWQEALVPYYEDELVTIYHADCRDILPSLRADAVITDPPYGLDFQYLSHDDNRELWFELMDAVVPMMRQAAPFVVMPCCGIDRMGWWYERHAPDWLMAWYKGSPGHRSAIGFNDWEAHLVWGKPPKQMHDYFHTVCGFDDNGHPCPKPIEWAYWLVERAAVLGGLVLDPFMGSGTTVRAAMELGRRAIGIEVEERYCEIAVARLSQQVMFTDTATRSKNEAQLALIREEL